MEKEKMNNTPEVNVSPDGTAELIKAPKFLTRKVKSNIFFWSTIAVFLINILIWYVYVNFSSFILAFNTYEYTTDGIKNTFAGFSNFKYVIDLFLNSSDMMYMVEVTVSVFVLELVVGIISALLLSYYIYKKLFMSEFFRVILFLPSVISAVVMVTLYKYMVNNMYMEVFNKDVGLLTGSMENKLIALIIYHLWMGYGTNVLMYTGAMSGINESIVEASELDGCNALQEFWHITMPGIFPTFVTFLTAGLAGVFTNQMQLYTFFGANAPIKSVGYYLYINNLYSDGLVDRGGYKGFLIYPHLSALGLIITFITIPIVMTVRWALRKYGPSTN